MSCCYSAFELLLLLGTWPSACYQRVDVLSQLLQTATLRLSYCLVCGHMLPTTAWGRSLVATRPATLRLSCCLVRGHLLIAMSGSGIINHHLCIRDEPGLKTKKDNHHSSEYSSPATHVREGSWGNVCVTRCMCEYSREHSCVYVVGVIQYWERVLISVLLSSDPKISSCLQEILGFKISSAGRIRAKISSAGRIRAKIS